MRVADAPTTHRPSVKEYTGPLRPPKLAASARYAPVSAGCDGGLCPSCEERLFCMTITADTCDADCDMGCEKQQRRHASVACWRPVGKPELTKLLNSGCAQEEESRLRPPLARMGDGEWRVNIYMAVRRKRKSLAAMLSGWALRADRCVRELRVASVRRTGFRPTAALYPVTGRPFALPEIVSAKTAHPPTPFTPP